MNELNIDFSLIKMNTAFNQILLIDFIVNPEHNKTKGCIILFAFKFKISLT